MSDSDETETSEASQGPSPPMEQSQAKINLELRWRRTRSGGERRHMSDAEQQLELAIEMMDSMHAEAHQTRRQFERDIDQRVRKGVKSHVEKLRASHAKEIETVRGVVRAELQGLLETETERCCALQRENDTLREEQASLRRSLDEAKQEVCTHRQRKS